MAINEYTKNHQTTNENIQKHWMYETKEPYCPVNSFLKYVSKLEPNSSKFFCERKTGGSNFKPFLEEIWYTKIPLGINKLGNLMKKNSQKLNLSQSYTNHSIRAPVMVLKLMR